MAIELRTATCRYAPSAEKNTNGSITERRTAIPAERRWTGDMTMGQHKYNPTALAAKEGKLPPKPKKMPQSELRGEIMSAFVRKYPKEASLMMALNMRGYGGQDE